MFSIRINSWDSVAGDKGQNKGSEAQVLSEEQVFDFYRSLEPLILYFMQDGNVTQEEFDVFMRVLVGVSDTEENRKLVWHFLYKDVIVLPLSKGEIPKEIA